MPTYVMHLPVQICEKGKPASLNTVVSELYIEVQSEAEDEHTAMLDLGEKLSAFLNKKEKA